MFETVMKCYQWLGTSRYNVSQCKGCSHGRCQESPCGVKVKDAQCTITWTHLLGAGIKILFLSIPYLGFIANYRLWLRFSLIP